MVYITETGPEEKIDVPVDNDNPIPREMLQELFPGAVSLMYEEDGNKKLVKFDNDESMTKLMPPAGGWGEKLFYIFRPQVQSLSGSVDARSGYRFREAWECSAPMADSIQQWMFYARDDAGKTCVVSIHPHYFATVRHGIHEQLLVGDSLMIYKAESDADKSFTATVVHIDENQDFILLKCETRVVEKGPFLVSPRKSEGFLLADYGKEQQNLNYLSGVVDDLNPHYFRGQNNKPTDSRIRGPFIFGTGLHSACDSGGACWSHRGLIGIKLGCTPMPTAPHDSAISDAAVYSPKIYIISSDFLETALMRELYKEESKNPRSSQSKKRPQVSIHGIGTVEVRSYLD